MPLMPNFAGLLTDFTISIHRFCVHTVTAPVLFRVRLAKPSLDS